MSLVLVIHQNEEIEKVRGELRADSVQFLRGTYDASRLSSAPVDRFQRWLNSELIITRRTGTLEPRARSWSGASLLLPVHHGARIQHWDLALYQDTQMMELFADVMVSSPADVGDAILIGSVNIASAGGYGAPRGSARVEQR